MQINPFTFRFFSNHHGYWALALWCIVATLLLRHDLYGLDESAAKSLLLSWSVADQVASSVATFGVPDLRVLLYLPIGFLWTGNVFAAKILTTLLLAVTAWLLYFWGRKAAGEECALLASGLLLISPLSLSQIDSLSPGNYLLATFAVGAWLDAEYRAAPKSFNGWYFVQLLVCAFGVSLHPAGLAYPLALIWTWRTSPLGIKHQKFLVGGIVFVALFILLIRGGWRDLFWLQNPIIGLASIFFGGVANSEQSVMQWTLGGTIAVTVIAIIFKQYRRLWSDLPGRILLLALLIGTLVGDQAWATIALCVLLYFGLPALLRPTDQDAGGFVRQRGLALVIVFICSTLFMLADRAHYEEGKNNTLSAQDQLIKTLAVEAENSRVGDTSDQDDGHVRPHFMVASQWPGRTMIACKCDTFPLPPPAPDPQAQLTKLHGITHLLLDPKQTANIELARNLSLLGGVAETISLQPGGVLLRIKGDTTPNSTTVTTQ